MISGCPFPPELKNADEVQWLAWARRQDSSIRARLQQGDLDSMVNLLFYGTSFTKQPRISMQGEGIAAASRAGVLRARVDDLVAGLGSPGDNERLVFLRRFVRSQGLDPEAPDGPRNLAYSSSRISSGWFRRGRSWRSAPRMPSPSLPQTTRRRSWTARRCSAIAGYRSTPAFSPTSPSNRPCVISKQRGVLREGQVARVAVIGPGLDFIDKNEASAYDYYPAADSATVCLVRFARPAAAGESQRGIDVDLRHQLQVIEHIQRSSRTRREGHGLCHPVAARHSATGAAGAHRLLEIAGRSGGNSTEPLRSRCSKGLRRSFRGWRHEPCESVRTWFSRASRSISISFSNTSI